MPTSLFESLSKPSRPVQAAPSAPPHAGLNAGFPPDFPHGPLFLCVLAGKGKNFKLLLNHFLQKRKNGIVYMRQPFGKRNRFLTIPPENPVGRNSERLTDAFERAERNADISKLCIGKKSRRYTRQFRHSFTTQSALFPVEAYLFTHKHMKLLFYSPTHSLRLHFV